MTQGHNFHRPKCPKAPHKIPAGRNYHILMQIAYVLWQVFDRGMLARLSQRCRKMTQTGWARLLAGAMMFVGLALVPKVSSGAIRMRRYHLVA